MHNLAGFFGIMVKKYKSGQIVDMQSKMYTRVNVTHIENPSTAIVGDDFEGENLDILYFQKPLFDTFILPRVEAHHELPLRVEILKKNRHFKSLFLSSGSKDGKIKNFITKVALMMYREKRVHNDTVLRCGPSTSADLQVLGDGAPQISAGTLALLVKGKLSATVTIKHKYGENLSKTVSRQVKAAILHEEGDIYGLYPDRKPLGHTTDIQTSLTTVSKVAFKVESDNAILYQIPLHKFQQLLETQSDLKFKVFLRNLRQSLLQRNAQWTQFAKKELRTQISVLGSSSVEYRDNLRHRHITDMDFTGSTYAGNKAGEIFESSRPRKQKKELGVRALVVNRKLQRNRKQAHSNEFKPLLKMLGSTIAASGVHHRSHGGQEKYSLYDRGSNRPLSSQWSHR
eukprot:g6301.t1